MPDSVISPEMQKAVGTELGRRTSYPVSVSDIRRWALAVYYPEPAPRQFWDEDFAASTPDGAIIAPQEFNPFAWIVASMQEPDIEVVGNDPNRTEKLLDVPGPGLKFMLNGGMEVDYGVPMKVGDVVTAVSRLGGYSERAGRLGQMLFTVTEVTWTNQDDEMVKRSRSTLIRY